MTEKEFKNMKCTFECKYDPKTKQSVNQKIDQQNFLEISPDDHSLLFKLAAKQAMDQDKSAQKKEIEKFSVKYQVLSKHTKMIGIKKNSEKSGLMSKIFSQKATQPERFNCKIVSN